MLDPKIQAILFDKDGTILDFLHTWHPVFIRFTAGVAASAGLNDEQLVQLRSHLGGNADAFDTKSLFATGPFHEILAAIRSFAPDFPDSEMKRVFMEIMSGDPLPAKEIPGASETLKQLSNEGYILGVATADRSTNTRNTLTAAGLMDHFDYIGTEDSVKSGKPHPDLMEWFCGETGLRPEQVAMVGDTMTDMKFARNAGAGQAIFVQSSFEDSEAEALADLVLPDMTALGAARLKG